MSEKQNKNDRNTSNNPDSEFPGYPHQPSSEDLLNPANSEGRVSTDPDELNRRNAYSATVRGGNDEQSSEQTEENEDELIIVPGTEADVTAEDLLLLGAKDGDMDMGDDELMRGKLDPVDTEDPELDIPGSELDDQNESIGEEDEENNYYSLGGDRHDGLEEDDQQEPEKID